MYIWVFNDFCIFVNIKIKNKNKIRPPVPILKKIRMIIKLFERSQSFASNNLQISGQVSVSGP